MVSQPSIQPKTTLVAALICSFLPFPAGGAEALGRMPLLPDPSHCLLNWNSRNAATLPWFDRASGPHAR